MASQTHKGTKS